MANTIIQAERVRLTRNPASETCGICLEPFFTIDSPRPNGAEVFDTFEVCHGSTYHPDCLRRWITESESCPLCRAHVQYPNSTQREQMYADLYLETLNSTFTEIADLRGNARGLARYTLTQHDGVYSLYHLLPHVPGSMIQNVLRSYLIHLRRMIKVARQTGHFWELYYHVAEIQLFLDPRFAEIPWLPTRFVDFAGRLQRVPGRILMAAVCRMMEELFDRELSWQERNNELIDIARVRLMATLRFERYLELLG